jgi:hypothetical protein
VDRPAPDEVEGAALDEAEGAVLAVPGLEWQGPVL